MINKVHSVRPSMHKLSNEQYQAMLDALEEKGGVALADRPYVERMLFFGRWSASKLTGIGLELSDFCFCEEGEITLPKVEVREAQRRCYKRALEVVEDRLRYHERTTSEERNRHEALEEANKVIADQHQQICDTERMMEFYKRSHEASLRKIDTTEENAKRRIAVLEEASVRKVSALEAEINRLRRKLAEYLTGDPNNQAAVDNAMTEPRYEHFQEAA